MLEKVPKDWGNLTTFMLHKKGNFSDPENFRTITLVSSLAKIFTQFICDRLVSWAESLQLIPESQAGFRKNRSCLDNLFNLLSVIQIHLSTPRSVVYAIFVDFKGAFPSVCH